MFGGTDKYAGNVVGSVVGASDGVVVVAEEVMALAGAEETLVGEGEGKHLACQGLDSSTGELAWVPVSSEDSYRKTVAMGQMTGMLRDRDRNSCFQQAIVSRIAQFVAEKGRAPLVLDIGTGSSLLAMMAIEAGAKHVYACEMFHPLAVIAANISTQNCPGRITIYSKHSSELTVGEGCDLPRRCDILVNELYDSALLGESCLTSIRHALAHLLVESNPIIIPESATLWCRLASSPTLRRMHSTAGVELAPGVRLARSTEAESCVGGRSPLPIRPSLIGDVLWLAPAVEAFHFSFNALPAYPDGGGRSVRFSQVADSAPGIIDAAISWWELDLGGGQIYSTQEGVMGWQDHWLMTAFGLGGSHCLELGDIVDWRASHSDTSICFELVKVGPSLAAGVSESRLLRLDHGLKSKSRLRIEKEWDPEPCSCGWHVICNQERFLSLHDKVRLNQYRAAIHQVLSRFVDRSSVLVLDVGEGSICGTAAAAQGAQSFLLDSKAWGRWLISQTLDRAHLSERCHIMEDSDDWPEGFAQSSRKIDCLMSECFPAYQMANAPLLAALSFWFKRAHVDPFLARPVTILPLKSVICAAGLALFDVYDQEEVRGSVLPRNRCHGPVGGSACGFDHGPYDEFVGVWDQQIFALPIALQFRHRIVTSVSEVLQIDYEQLPHDISSHAQLHPNAAGEIHAVVFWVEYVLDHSSTRISPVDDGGTQFMPGHGRQLVRYLHVPRKVQKGKDLDLVVHSSLVIAGGIGSFNVSVTEETTTTSESRDGH
jgi:protein arginine N-methyltransferase 7